MNQEIAAALKRAKELAKERPELKSDIMGLIELMTAEISEGESWRNELDHFEASLHELEEGDVGEQE